MIYFADKDGDTLVEGHIQTLSAFEDHELQEVFIAQADGDELMRALTILGKSQELVKVRRVYKFVGDEARTIAANW